MNHVLVLSCAVVTVTRACALLFILSRHCSTLQLWQGLTDSERPAAYMCSQPVVVQIPYSFRSAELILSNIHVVQTFKLFKFCTLTLKTKFSTFDFFSRAPFENSVRPSAQYSSHRNRVFHSECSQPIPCPRQPFQPSSIAENNGHSERHSSA